MRRWAVPLAAITIGAAPIAAQDGSATNGIRFEKVANCDGFLEGPSFSPDGFLRVVDFLGGRVFEVRGAQCVEIAQTGGRANGAKHDAQGRLWIADADRGILRLERDGSLTAVVDKIEGEPLTGANDLVFDSSGGLYFTVPGSSTWSNRTGRIYYLPPQNGATPRLFRSDLAFPNGVTLSPDDKYVFTTLFADKAIIAFPSATNSDGMQLDYRFVNTRHGVGPDGILTDSQGRMLWANFGGHSISAASFDGRLIADIPLPPAAGDQVTNIAEQDGAYFITEASKSEIWKMTGF